MSGRRYASPAQTGRVDHSGYDARRWEGVPVKPARAKERKPKAAPKPKRPDQLVGEAAVAAAHALVDGGYSTSYDAIRQATLRGLACAFAHAYGMTAPLVDSHLAALSPASRTAFVQAVRRLDYEALTPEHFGHVHEHLTAWTLKAGELVPSSERRGGGVHFTPRSLTEPIVRKTLEPLLRTAPFDDPANTLQLRVCDPSVGAGAFLLEVCRQLGQRLVDAGIESDILVAKRLVAVHCCYGVDVSPWAVASAKIALWLECRADMMPATWLDGNIKTGDALVGLSREQIACFHWDPKSERLEVPELRSAVEEAVRLGAELRRLELLELSASTRGSA